MFNTATSIEKVCSKFEFDEEETTEFTKGDPEFRPQTFFLEDGSKSVVRAKFGSYKTAARSIVKMEEGSTLKDLNRVSLEFEDPLALGLMYRVTPVTGFLILLKILRTCSNPSHHKTCMTHWPPEPSFLQYSFQFPWPLQFD